MIADMNSLLSDLEQDYKKLSAECKRKYSTVKDIIEISLKSIDTLKNLSSSKDSSEKFKEELSQSSDFLFKPIIVITDNKYSKLYLYCSHIIKKLVSYNLVSNDNSTVLITLLKEIFEGSNEDIQLKILETLQLMISSNKMKIENENINKVMIISCKLFSLKNIEFKNPIKLLFQTFMKTIMDNFIQNINSNPNELKECLNTFLKNLLEIIEGKKKDWINPTVNSKCLGVELLINLIQGGNIIFKDEKYFKGFLEKEVSELINKILNTTNDSPLGIKLCRLILVIVQNLKICYPLLEIVFNFSIKDTLCWQKFIGMECLSIIMMDSFLIFDLYKNHKSIYDKILDTITTISYNDVIRKKALTESNTSKKDSSKNISDNINTSFNKTKAIENTMILTEGENIPLSINTPYLIKLLTEIYQNLLKTFYQLMERNGLKLNETYKNFTEEQNDIKEFLSYKYVMLKGVLTALLLNTNDQILIQSYLSIIQSLISIFACVSLVQIRDSYLDDLCKLAIPNNLDNYWELKDKNILITRTIFNMAHCVNILDYNSWLFLIEAIQNLYLMLVKTNLYSLTKDTVFDIEVIIKNLDFMIKKYSYETPTSEIQEMNKINEEQSGKGEDNLISTSLPHKKSSHKGHNVPKRQITQEEKYNLEILANILDTLFIDSDYYDENTLKDICNAFKENTKKVIQDIESLQNQSDLKDSNTAAMNLVKSGNSNLTFLNFNLVKILELSTINGKRIEVIWDIISELFHFILSKKLNVISKFSIEILTTIIIFVIGKYEKNLREEKKESLKEEKKWDIKEWQGFLLKPLIEEVSAKEMSQEMFDSFLNNLQRLLDKSGILLNNSGWSAFIIMLEKLIYTKVEMNQIEKIFKIVEHIMNEYSTYLTIFNIEPMLNILEKFSMNTQNNNICYSSVSFFWSCADICENFQKRNVNLTENQKQIYELYLPTKEKQDEFFKKNWIQIFAKLLNINHDERYDIRKSGINVFCEFFVAKINSLIELGVSDEIIENIFFEILNKNCTKLEQRRQQENTPTKEWEDTIVITLQAVGKTFKAYITKQNEEENKAKLYKHLLKILEKIIKISTPEIDTNILKIFSEVASSNKNLFSESFTFLWDIFDEMGQYISKDDFITKYSNYNIGSILIASIIETFKQIFISYPEYQKILNEDKNLEKLLNLVKILLSAAYYTEGKIPENTPLRTLRIEKEIFSFLNDLINSNKEEKVIQALFEFLLPYIILDKSKPHSESIMRNCIDLMNKIFNNEVSNKEKDFPLLIEKIKPIIISREDNDIVQLVIKHNKDSSSYLWVFLSNEVLKLFSSMIDKLKDEKCWLTIIELFEKIFIQSQTGYKKIDKTYQEELIKSCQEMEIQIINYIVDTLIPNSFNISIDLQKKLLTLFDLGSNLDYSVSFTNNLSINKMCLSTLFDICKYKSEEEMTKDCSNTSKESFIKDIINVKTKIAKICTPILLKRCKNVLQKYLEDEIKSGAMPLSRSRLEEVKFIFEKLKNLEVFPNFHIVEEKKETEEIKIKDAVMKSKKAHLFLLHDLFSDFITTKELDLKILVKDIFKTISKSLEE
ncbi:MAG: hypothetical protein MJ252_01625 [archaeon]|nr:hypothetical protein [archaeon]